jgi:hypothetical protein
MTAIAPPPRNRTPRAALLARIHASRSARPDLVEEDSWRAFLRRAVRGGERLSVMTDGELAIVAAALSPSRRGARASLSPSHAKARALWIVLAGLGAVVDRSDRALDAFCRRQTGLDAWSWFDQRACRGVIEALKAWIARVGTDPVSQAVAALTGSPAERLQALWHRLALEGLHRTPEVSDFWFRSLTLHQFGRAVSLAEASDTHTEAALRALAASWRRHRLAEPSTPDPHPKGGCHENLSTTPNA